MGHPECWLEVSCVPTLLAPKNRRDQDGAPGSGTPNGDEGSGAEARFFSGLYAGLKARSSTVASLREALIAGMIRGRPTQANSGLEWATRSAGWGLCVPTLLAPKSRRDQDGAPGASTCSLAAIRVTSADRKKGPLGVRGQSALVLSLCESLIDLAFLLRLSRWLRRSTLRGGLRGILLRRTNR